MGLKPETIAAHIQRHAKQRRFKPMHEKKDPTPTMRPATDEEKLAYLAAMSHGFTRGLFRDVPLDEIPLYHNGHDFYMLMAEVRKPQRELPF